jgi:hypothetical protein
MGIGSLFFGIDDERTVEPAMNVLGKGQGMTVVEMGTERLGHEVVGEGFAGSDLAEAGNTSIPAGWKP